MDKELEQLYKTVSSKFDVGTFDDFKSKMATPEDRKSFYDVVGKKGYDLGDYKEYETRLGKPKEVKAEPSGVSTSASAKNTSSSVSDTITQPKQEPVQNLNPVQATVPEKELPVQDIEPVVINKNYDGFSVVNDEQMGRVVDFGNGIQIPESELPEQNRKQPIVERGKQDISQADYIAGDMSKFGDELKPEEVTKEFNDWQDKGWGTKYVVDGKDVFAPNPEGRKEIQKVYDSRVESFNNNIVGKAKEETPLAEFSNKFYEKYGTLLTEEERGQLNTQEGRDRLELQYRVNDLIKNDPNLTVEDAYQQVQQEYVNKKEVDNPAIAKSFIDQRLENMNWGMKEDTASETSWLNKMKDNPEFLKDFGNFLSSDEGKSYTSSINSKMSTLNQKDFKDVIDSYYSFKQKQNDLDNEVNIENYRKLQRELLASGKSGDPEAVQSIYGALTEVRQQIQEKDQELQDLVKQKEATEEIFTEANYWEDQAGKYYSETENGQNKVESVIDGASVAAVGALKRTGAGLFGILASPMALFGDKETRQAYYDINKQLGKEVEMKGTKLHDSFYSQTVVKDKGTEYIRLDKDGTVYQRDKDGTLTYVADPEGIDFSKGKKEEDWSAYGIANAVQSFGWDIYLANRLGGGVTKSLSSVTEAGALSTVTRNFATLEKLGESESFVGNSLDSMTKALRSPHTATNVGFFVQMYPAGINKAHEAGIESDAGAQLYATTMAAFNAYLIGKIVPSGQMSALNSEAQTIVKQLSENKLGVAAQRTYDFLKKTAPEVAHTYATMLGIESGTVITDSTVNKLFDTKFNTDQEESMLVSSAKGALPLILFSTIAKVPALLEKNNKLYSEGKITDISKMSRDELITTLARQGDAIIPLLKKEQNNGYFQTYKDEVGGIIKAVESKKRLIDQIPEYDKYDNKTLDKLSGLLDQKSSIENEMKNANDAFKFQYKEKLEGVQAQIEEIVKSSSEKKKYDPNAKTGEELITTEKIENEQAKESPTTKSKSPENVEGTKGETDIRETESKKEEVKLIKESEDGKISEYLESPVKYKTPTGETVDGILKQDGQRVVVESKDKIHDLGNVEEISDNGLSKHSLSVVDKVEINDKGNVEIRGKEYVNNYSEPKSAITYDKEGNIQSVTLDTPTGQKRTFRGQTAEDIAYQIHSKDFTKQVKEEVDLNQKDNFDKFIGSVDNLINLIDKHTKDTLGISIIPAAAKGALKIVKATAIATKNTVKAIEAGIDHLKKSDWYRGLTKDERLEFDKKSKSEVFDSMLKASTKKDESVAEKRVDTVTIPKTGTVKSTVRANTGQTDSSNKVTTTEKHLVKDKFKNLQRGFKTGVKETEALKREFIDSVKTTIKGLGKDMNTTDIKSILNQVGKVNAKNIDAVEAVIDRLVDRVENRQFDNELRSTKQEVGKLGRSKSDMTPVNIKDLAKSAKLIDEKYLDKSDKEKFLNALNTIKNAFKPVGNQMYVMADTELVQKELERLYEVSQQKRSEELGARLGIDITGMTHEEVQMLWKEENVDEYASNLAEAKQKEVRDAFVQQGDYSKMVLDFVDETNLTPREKKDLRVLNKADFSGMSLNDIKKYIKIIDNIITNNDFSNVGQLTSKIEGDIYVKSLSSYIDAKKIKVRKVDKLWINGITSLNVFLDDVMGSPEAGGIAYRYTGIHDLSNAKTRSFLRTGKFNDDFNSYIAKVAKQHPSVKEGRDVVKRSVYSTLLQAELGNAESMAHFKKNYIEHTIEEIETYTNNKQDSKKVEILKQTLNELKDITTKEELIDYLKTKDKGNYDILKFASDNFLKHADEMRENAYRNHGEHFDQMDTDAFYLPLSRVGLQPKSIRENKSDAKDLLSGLANNRSIDPASGSIISRKKNAKLGNSEIIELDFDKFVQKKYNEQIYDIEATESIMKLQSILRNPDMAKKLGSSMKELGKRAIDKISIDSGSVYNSMTEIERGVAKAERILGKVGTVNALGGVSQYAKQYPSVILGASVRLMEHGHASLLVPLMFTNKGEIELLKMSSVAMRGANEGATKRVGDDVNLNKLSVTEKTELEKMARNLSKGFGIGLEKAREISMLSLRKGDVNAANTTFLAYYKSYLLRNGVKESEIDFNNEHTKVQEGDKVRNEALSYAQSMVNTTQMSSDLSEGSKIMTNPDLGMKVLTRTILPFSQFSNNAVIRFVKALGNIQRDPKANITEAVASLTEIIAFQSMKAMIIAPAFAGLGAILFNQMNNDDDEKLSSVDAAREALTKEGYWKFAGTKAASGVIGDIVPTPDSFDIDILNYGLYQMNKDQFKTDEGETLSFKDYNKLLKRMQFDEEVRKETIPFQFYRYGDKDGWDITAGGSTLDNMGLYQIPLDQAKKTREAWDIILDGKTTKEGKYGDYTNYKVDLEKYKTFLIMNTIMETAGAIGVGDADTRRMFEKQFQEILNKSKDEGDSAEAIPESKYTK